MSWVEHHKRSERLASEAQVALFQNRKTDALKLYAQAADAEDKALADLDRSKVRTVGISAVSAASLYCKAGNLERAGEVAAEWLRWPTLPDFAKDQLRSLQRSISKGQLAAGPIEDNRMPKAPIYGEILDWSAKRPPWQQDALRRLVSQEQLDESDIADLASLCKAKHGLDEKKDPKPLKKNHLPAAAAAGQAVRLTKLTHEMGVNALAPNQTIEFGPNLTVVYGDNGAGKSGYARILKRACRARGSDPILGNVTSGAPPPVPSAVIRYSVGEKSTDFSWEGRLDSDQPLSRVSVFDRQCASVYIAERTDVAFRPMGLDLFDRLADVSEGVRKVLEREMKNLEDQEPKLPTALPNTPVASFLENITALTDSDEVRSLGQLSDVDVSRMNEIRAHLQDIETNNPEAVAKTLSLRADRLSTFLDQLADVSARLSDSSVRELLQAKSALRESEAALERRTSEFKSMPVSGVGSPPWRKLWDAARYFFTSEAYPHESHPSRDALCVLCQQPHSDESFGRMEVLERHISSTIQLDHEEAERKYRSAQDDIERAIINKDDAIPELSIDNPELSDEFASLVNGLEVRRESVLAAMRDDGPAELSVAFASPDLSSLSEQIAKLRARATAITKSNSETDPQALRNELADLESRRTLHTDVDLVLAEITRKRKIAVYQQCIRETRTNAITAKSKELTKRVVTGRLVQAFTDELTKLKFHHVEVDLIEAGGQRGALYHKLALTRAPDAKVAEIVSEGEARCMSIASFFAELSTADDRSAILFDDPVSSLDQAWRDSVAERLVTEAASRQVIVFTHDLVFLRVLLDRASEQEVEIASCILRRKNRVPGFATMSLPMFALKTSKHIGRLRSLWQDAKKLYMKGEQEEYERIGGEIYGRLRASWERGVEEVLLNGVVERFRREIQTLNRIKSLSDISEEDCTAVQKGMSKCSRFLLGHDQSPADRMPFPEPDELKSDIDAFDSWVQTIRKRRKRK